MARMVLLCVGGTVQSFSVLYDYKDTIGLCMLLRLCVMRSNTKVSSVCCYRDTTKAWSVCDERERGNTEAASVL